MRIRKNAKLSTLLNTNTNTNTNVVSNVVNESLLQKNLCQLNQSPWDIITFPSSSSLQQFGEYEVTYCNVNHAGNGSLIGSVGDYERKITFGDGLASMKTSGGEIDKLSADGENDKLSVDPKNDYTENVGFEDGEMNDVGEELILLCDVRDEKGWQCGRMVKNGETMCVHHVIDQLQKHAVWTTKKKPKPEPRPVHESKEGTRSRQPKKRASTSPYEFYYYSGFGPTWGKKRGTTAESSFSNTCNESVINDDMGILDDEDDDKKGKTGKKRGRKPMKARSLKSLI